MADGLLGIASGSTNDTPSGPVFTVSPYPSQWETGEVITADKLNYPNSKKLWVDQWGMPTFEQIQEIYNDGYKVLEDDQRIGYIIPDDESYVIILHYKSNNPENVDYSVISLTSTSSQMLNISILGNQIEHMKSPQAYGRIPLSSAVFDWNSKQTGGNYLKYQGWKVFQEDYYKFVAEKRQMAWLRVDNQILVPMEPNGISFVHQQTIYQVERDEAGYAIITATTNEENPL